MTQREPRAAVEMPPLGDDEYAALKADIEKRGQQIPIEMDADTGEVLDGANRLRICDELGIEPLTVGRHFATQPERVEHALKLNILRRHMDPVTWGEQFKRLAEVRGVRLGKGGDRRSESTATLAVGEIAAELGMPQRTAERRIQAASLPEPEKEAVRSGEKTVSAALRDHKREKKRATAKVRNLAALTTEVSFEVHAGDFHSTLSDVRDAAVIVTDPPYAAEFMPLYGEMAECAKRWLRPRGVCAVMCGQMHLPSAMAELSAHLDYHWTMAYLTPGGQAVQIFPRQVNTFWKPVVLLTNGPSPSVIADEWLGDVAKSDVNDNDKRHHEWGQSESGMADLLRRLTVPGDLVVDPFMGAGTTGVAALALGRSFVGCDTDKKHVATARRRMKQVERERRDAQ